MKAQQECIFIFGFFVCLRLYFPVNNYSAMSAKWRLTVHPILGYQGEKGGGCKCPPIVFLEGANIHHYAFVEGAIILPCQLLGGQMSTHAIFHRGADVRGEDVRLPSKAFLKHRTNGCDTLNPFCSRSSLHLQCVSNL